MKIDIYQIDAFTDRVFGGNPAAVCLLQDWISDEKMQQIATENNLSETAFFVGEGENYYIRWFTPASEINLCGHATLASAYLLFRYLNNTSKKIHFQYGEGVLTVEDLGELFEMEFPASTAHPVDQIDLLTEALGKAPLEVYKSRDLMAVYGSEQDILDIQPDFNKLAKLDAMGIIITSRGEQSDFVSRFFAPVMGITEDPVTGSAHCTLIPYWAQKLSKNKMVAYQLSKRGGILYCQYSGERVKMAGRCAMYMKGEIFI